MALPEWWGRDLSLFLKTIPIFEITALIASKRSAGKTYREALAGRWKLTTPCPEWVLDMSLPQIGDSLYTLKYRYRTSDMFAEWIAVKIK